MQVISFLYGKLFFITLGDFVFALFLIQLYNTNKRNAEFSKLIFNFYCLLSPTCFEPLGFILRKTDIQVDQKVFVNLLITI
jgi:hypothetical protein